MTRYRFAWWWALGCVLTVATLPLSAQTQRPGDATGEEDDPIEVEIVEDDEDDDEPSSDEAETEREAAAPTSAVEPPPQALRSRWVAGAWCALRSSGGEQQPADPAADGPSGGQGENGEDDNGSANTPRNEEHEIGCDVGAGMRLVGRCYSQGCVSLIGALGMKTVGFGVAWTVISVGDRPVSIAIGYAFPFDGEGIYSDVGAVVIGATVSVGGLRR